MKKITFLLAILLFGSMANASEKFTFSNEISFPSNINDAEPIQFIERGIEFYIFSDGQFDFNTVVSQGENYYKTGRRDFNATFGTTSPYNSGIKIEHDNFGRIRRVGNVFINYDFDNRIKRIGSVYMSYNRFALSQVGGLRIIYNRFGQIVDYVGNVKNRSSNYNFNETYNFNSYNFNEDNYENNDNESSGNDYYYYRKDGTKAKVDKNKKIEKK